MRPAMESVFDEWRPDLVLRDPCEYASAVVAAGRDVPHAQVAISVAEGEAASIAVAAPALEGHRPGLADRLRASPYLTRMPASLDPSPFPDTVRFREGRNPRRAVPPAWWVEAEPPRVYISFGTVLGHMTMAGAVYRTVVAAAADLPGTVLLTLGRTFDPAGLGPVPPHVRVERWVDQAAVVNEADAVVCHGGSGTAFGALAAGVPLVMMPLFADQRTNAARIAAAGAGIAVAPPDTGFDRDGNRPVPVQLDAAVETVLAAPTYRAAARRLAIEMASLPTADEALARVSPAAGRGSGR
jgi:UDP:flavonoid glycosyltransferase YjiC (YdhE family)